MSNPESYYLIAGETSGDIYGGELIHALKSKNEYLRFHGVGGPHMTHAGLTALCPWQDFQVMGFSDVISAYPKLKRHAYSLAAHILQEQPKGVIFIDYPGFNLRLATLLRKKGFRGQLIQFIAPTVWAWKKGRIKTMAATLDLLLTIFPFENAYFNHTSLKTLYVGNPTVHLLNQVPFDPSWRKRANIPSDIPLMALFPGSRPAEIKRNLPIQLQAAALFIKTHQEFGVVIASHAVPKDCLNERVWIIPQSDRFHLMHEADVALAKSGTVILELALKKCPTVVSYQLSALNYFLAKYIFRIQLPYYSLPNILLGESLFPEWYHMHLSPQKLAHSLEIQLQRKKYVSEKQKELMHMLSPKNVPQEAAKAILNL